MTIPHFLYLLSRHNCRVGWRKRINYRAIKFFLLNWKLRCIVASVSGFAAMTFAPISVFLYDGSRKYFTNITGRRIEELVRIYFWILSIYLELSRNTRDEWYFWIENSINNFKRRFLIAIKKVIVSFDLKLKIFWWMFHSISTIYFNLWYIY